MGSESPGRFTTLDGLRGAAAITVLAYHCSSNAFPMAYAAVDFFFLLSGFVLAHTYGERLLEKDYIKTFAQRRFLRLYPTYAISSLAGAAAVAALIGMIPDWSLSTYIWACVSAIFMLPLPVNVSLGIFPLDGPAWSLFFEALVNILFCFTAARLRPSLILVVLSFPALLYSVKTWYGGGGSMWEDILGGVPRVVFSFYLGVIVYIFWKRGIRIRPGKIGYLLLILFPLLYWSIWFSERKFDLFLIVVAHPLLVLLAAEVRLGGRAEKFGRWLGDISYPIYLFHIPVLFMVASATGNCQGLFDYLGVTNPQAQGLCRPTAGIPAIAIVLPATIALSHLYTYRLDPHIRRWLATGFGAPRRA